jgi:hypothetical protein
MDGMRYLALRESDAQRRPKSFRKKFSISAQIAERVAARPDEERNLGTNAILEAADARTEF